LTDDVDAPTAVKTKKDDGTVLTDGTKRNTFVEAYATAYKAAAGDMNAFRTATIQTMTTLRTTIQDIRAGDHPRKNDTGQYVKKDGKTVATDQSKEIDRATEQAALAEIVNTVRRTKYATGAFASFANQWRDRVGTVQGINTSAGKQ
jgi:hypothetical protein